MHLPLWYECLNCLSLLVSLFAFKILLWAILSTSQLRGEGLDANIFKQMPNSLPLQTVAWHDVFVFCSLYFRKYFHLLQWNLFQATHSKTCHNIHFSNVSPQHKMEVQMCLLSPAGYQLKSLNAECCETENCWRGLATCFSLPYLFKLISESVQNMKQHKFKPPAMTWFP